MLTMLTERQEQVTNSVRDYLRTQLPQDFVGPVGDKICDSLTEVREFHWEDHDKLCTHWGYELVFTLDGEPITLRKTYTIDRLARDLNGNIPYMDIMQAIVLTSDELVLLATGV